jgi:hypothetical protein
MTDPWIWGAFTARMLGTAFVVIAISWVSVRAGPRIGGVIVGLPIVLAPGLGFMLLDQSGDFVAAAAAGALYSLAATQAFLLVFVALAQRSGPFASVAGAALAWLSLAIPLSLFPHPPLLGALLFAAMTITARRIGLFWVSGADATAATTKWGLMALRGILAGILVGAVTLGASVLGTGFSGALMAFPIGFTVIAVSLHLDHGGAFAAQTAYAGLTGMTSLAIFCLCLALLLRDLPGGMAFALALAASVLATVVMTMMARRRAQGRS